MTDTELPIVDDVERHRFVYAADGFEALLAYRVNGVRLVLVHTEVPDEWEGRGIGGQLVLAAVERAEASGETVVPLCPFVRSWLERHPDDADRVVIDWSSSPAA